MLSERDELLEAIAGLLAEEREVTVQCFRELLTETRSLRSALMDTAELAAYLKVDRKFVERHRAELGGIPLGETGRDRKPRWRFEREASLQAYKGLAALSTAPPAPPPSKPRRRRRVRSGVRLLPVKGEG